MDVRKELGNSTIRIEKNHQIVFESETRGIQPLIDCLQQGIDVRDAIAYDRVIGKAAAYLYVILKIKCIYTDLVSELALEILNQYHIKCIYGYTCEMILNRNQDGYCPMESCVKDIYDIQEAKIAIHQKLQQLKKGKDISSQ